jgi:hypothetical protein
MARSSAEHEDRIPRARLAAHRLHAKLADPAVHTAPARKPLLSRFEREVDPDGVLDPAERAGGAGLSLVIDGFDHLQIPTRPVAALELPARTLVARLAAPLTLPQGPRSHISHRPLPALMRQVVTPPRELVSKNPQWRSPVG